MHIIIALFLSLLAVMPTSAQTTSDSASNADANAVVNNYGGGNIKTKEKATPNLITPFKLDPGNVFPVQPSYIPKENEADESLPEVYKIEGWKILSGPPHQAGIPVTRILNERDNSWFIDEDTSKTGLITVEKAEKDNDLVFPLQSYPIGIPEVAHSTVFGKGVSNINSVLMRAVYNVWEKSDNAKNIIILYNPILVSRADVKALGTALVGGALIDKASGAVASVGGGTGFGNTESYIKKRPMFMVIAFAKGPAALYLTPPAAADEKVKDVEKLDNLFEKITESEKGENKEAANQNSKAEEVPPPPPAPTKAEEVAPAPEPAPHVTNNLIQILDVNFAFDKAEIASEEMEKIKEAAKRIYDGWDEILKNNAEIRVIGGASEEGSNGYNNTLAMNRAINCATELAKILLNEYKIPAQELQPVIKFASAGKYEKEYTELSKNRRAYFLLAKRL